MDKEEKRLRRNAAAKRYRLRNKEKCAVAQKSWRDRNPGYTVQWNHKNPEKVKVYRARTNAKPETKAYREQWRKDNPDKIKAYQAISNERFPPRIRMQNWRANNLEHARKKNAENARKWRAENREHHKEVRRQWELANREMLHDYCANRRGQLGGKSLSRGLVVLLLQEQGGRCPYCSCDLLEAGLSIDHYLPLHLDGPHEDDNIQLLCGPCNSRKNKKHPADFASEVFSFLK